MNGAGRHILDYKAPDRGSTGVDGRFVAFMAAGFVSFVGVLAAASAVQLYRVAKMIRYDEAAAWGIALAFVAFVCLAQWRLGWRGFAQGALLGLALTAVAALAFYLWWASSMSFEG